MASNFAGSKTMPFSVAQVSTLMNVSCTLATLIFSFWALDVRRPSSTYPRIFIPAFLSSFVSILNRGTVNNIKRIGATGDPCGTLILTGSWSPVSPSRPSAAVRLLRMDATHLIIVRRIPCSHNLFTSRASVTRSNAPLISNASAVTTSWS